MAYLETELAALKETVAELMLGAGAASVKVEVEELKRTIAANERQFKALDLEKQILVKKIEQLKSDMAGSFTQGSQGVRSFPDFHVFFRPRAVTSPMSLFRSSTFSFLNANFLLEYDCINEH